MKKKFYVGTYNNDENSGIFKLDLDTETGEISGMKQIIRVLNPSYMVINKEKEIIYSVFKKGTSGGVAASRITDEISEPFSESLSEGHLPCHINLDKKGMFLFSANYQTGVIKVYELDENGGITRVSSEVNHSDMELGEVHPHYVGLTPDEKYLFVVDLGLDMIILYNYSTGKIGEVFQKVLFKKGCGPRHITFSNDGEYAYLITEYSVEVVTLKYSVTEGFKILEYIPALSDEFYDEGDGGAIRISEDGTKLYSSSRKPGSVSIFSLDKNTRKPVLISTINSYGEHPRDINILDEVLISANRFSNNLTTFLLDKNKKHLIKGDYEISLNEPTNIIF